MAVVTTITKQAEEVLDRLNISHEYGYGDAYHFGRQIPQKTSVDIAEQFTLQGTKFIVTETTLQLEQEVKPASPLETVEDQQAKAYKDWVGKGKDFQVGDMVVVYDKYGNKRMRVAAIFDTPVEHVKLYELRTGEGSRYHATKDFIDKI